MSPLPDPDNNSHQPGLEESILDSPGFTPVSHPGLLDWNAANVDDRPLYVEDSTSYEDENGQEGEALYANEADIQAVEEVCQCCSGSSGS